MISPGHCIGALHIGALFGKPGGKKVVFSSTVPNLQNRKRPTAHVIWEWARSQLHVMCCLTFHTSRFPPLTIWPPMLIILSVKWWCTSATVDIDFQSNCYFMMHFQKSFQPYLDIVGVIGSLKLGPLKDAFWRQEQYLVWFSNPLAPGLGKFVGLGLPLPLTFAW